MRPVSVNTVEFGNVGNVSAPSSSGNRDIGAVEGPAFSDTLQNAINNIDSLQTDADSQASAVASGGGNLHEMALAFEKADVAMRMAVKVRNKVVDAYNEVMRMSI